MQRIAAFEKVSREQFTQALKKQLSDTETGIWKDGGKGGEELDSVLLSAYENIEFPRRATRGSAGYDFFAPASFRLLPEQTVTVPSGIRVRMEEGWVLMLFPRSGLGFKYRLQLNNTVGVIDSDYYDSDNEGHIMIRITNDSKDGKAIEIKEGEAFAQGVFLPYGITEDDTAEGVRNGGFGSTSR